MHDFLHTVDWIVDDPVGVARRLASVFGLPEVRPDFEQVLPTHGYEAVFSRAAGRLAEAPTRLELIAPRPVVEQPGCSVAPLALVAELQVRRSQRTHATVVCVADFDGAVDQLHRRGTPVWVEAGCEHLPHRRAWVGWSGPGSFVPGHDGGLWLELIATAALGPQMVDAVAQAASSAAPAGPPATRVGRRVHLVGDLDATLRTLDAACGFVPAAGTTHDARLGGRVASFGFRHPASARLDLVQPRAPGPAADYFGRWGEGPWLTTLTWPDRAAAEAAEAAARTAGATPVADLTGDGSVVLAVEGLGGILVEIATDEGDDP